MQIERLVDCTIVSGSVIELASCALLQSALPQLTLLHAGPDVRRSTFLFVGARFDLATHVHGGAAEPSVAFIAPLAKVLAPVMSSGVRVDDSPLVRASRAVLETLARELPRQRPTAPGPLEDILLSLVRGILHEDPRVMAADARGIPLQRRIEALIEVRHPDPRLDVARIAAELHTSRRQLYRHASEGGVAAMLVQRRLRTAKELIDTRPDLTIAEIARRSGFTTAARLRAQFVGLWGQTPADYRAALGPHTSVSRVAVVEVREEE